MINSVFITGTDTGIGKTFYSQLLLQSLNAAGMRTAAMKPLASGAELYDGKLRNADALVLQQTANTVFPYARCNPYCFAPPIAPHLAARQAAVRIEFDVIQQAYEQLLKQADFTVVEGVGGWLVPMDQQHTIADLVQAMRLPVILVVGMRLGCINHALLTAENIRRRGIPLIGWVANVIEPGMLYLQENVEAIAQRIAAPLLDVIDFINQPEQIEAQPRLNIKWLEY
jgi:dethiobiotin synthetase